MSFISPFAVLFRSLSFSGTPPLFRKLSTSAIALRSVAEMSARENFIMRAVYTLTFPATCLYSQQHHRMPNFAISAKAYAKIVLHCCKYPQRAVNGVVIGTFSDKDQGAGVLIQDAVPLFHQNLSLAPMLEVALRQVYYGQHVHYIHDNHQAVCVCMSYSMLCS